MELVQQTADCALTERETLVLEAVIRTHVETAEPAGSRALARRYAFGVSAATIRNTMADLEAKGYLAHPHPSAGRVPTDLAYRFFVDRIMQPDTLTPSEQARIKDEVRSGDSSVERIVRNATRALGVLVSGLGVGSVPPLDDARLLKLDLVPVSSNKVLMVVAVQSGAARTVYVDLPGAAPATMLEELERVLNERLAGLSFRDIRGSFGERLRDAADDQAAQDMLNFFVQSGEEVFGAAPRRRDDVVLGRTSAIATQPEFASSERLMNLIELTERKELLAAVLGDRATASGPCVTIGAEHGPELAGFTVVTSGYRIGAQRGIVGVIGPTRMSYEKVVAIVDYTSSFVTRMLEP